MFYGKKKEELNKTFFTKYFKENGYITSHTHDLCLLDSTRANHNYTIEEVFDHQMVVCDPDNDHISLTSIRCLHGKQNMEYFLDYTDQFWRKYPNNRKLSVIISNHGHEGTLNVVKYIDDMLYNFINNLFNDHLLKDTSIILISDHGAGMPSVYYTFDFYTIEMYMPMLYIWMNDRKNVTYEEQYGNLFDNQQTYITHLDIYNTLIHFLYGDKYNEKNTTYKDAYRSELGISIFNKINPKERYKEKYTHIYPITLTTCKRATD
jgi:membrane-anchored protein YejM (alkaline phosphatase superfamily)